MTWINNSGFDVSSIDTALEQEIESLPDNLQSLAHEALFYDRNRIRALLTIIWARHSGLESAEPIPAALAVEFIYAVNFIPEIQEKDELVSALKEQAYHLLDSLSSKAKEELEIAFSQQQEKVMGIWWKDYVGKTSALIAAACVLGVISEGGSEEQIEKARRFGEEFALAYQIIEDAYEGKGLAADIGKEAALDQGHSKLYDLQKIDPGAGFLVLSGMRNLEGTNF